METGRVEAFSDGVFAIAITLLILAVGVDQARASGSLSHQLLHLWPAYIAYAVSFVTVGIMWINHHMIFRHFARVDRIMLLLNILLLMLISFTPFPTRVVAEFAHTNTDRRAAALLYGIKHDHDRDPLLRGLDVRIAAAAPSRRGPARGQRHHA